MGKTIILNTIRSAQTVKIPNTTDKRVLIDMFSQQMNMLFEYNSVSYLSFSFAYFQQKLY